MIQFNKGDRRAIIFLASLVILSLTIVVFFGTRNDDSSDDTDCIADSRDYQGSKKKSGDANQIADSKNSGCFDPNTVDSISLINYGLKPYQVHAFIRYRDAGAVFRKPLDISRLNCLNDDDIERLLPLIKISNQYSNRRVKYPIAKSSGYKTKYNKSYENYNSYKSENDNHSTYKQHIFEKDNKTNTSNVNRKFESLTLVDVNTADTTLLKRVPGIGSYTAKRIVGLRTQLGAIHPVRQLSLLPHMSQDVLEWLTISQQSIQNIKKININTATFNQLRQHPYIGYDHARDIQRYINIYGKVRNEEQLLSANIFQPEEMKLLSPYLEY